MGGHAFKNLDLIRINKCDVEGTIAYVVDHLSVPGFDLEYATSSLMGSTGKKSSSGDIDFAMNTHVPKLFGEIDLPVFNKHEVLRKIQSVLPENRINSKTFRMGNLMTAWPILGDETKGLIQVDFVFGKRDWLLFTHYSPGDESRYKGVFISQAFGVLAKMRKEYEEFDPDNGERIARVGLHMSLEHGLFRKWEGRRRIGMGASEIDPDAFETRFAKAERFTRIGHIDDPDTVIKMLLGDNVCHDDVNTFEKFVGWMKRNHPDKVAAFKDRVLTSLFTKSGAKHDYKIEDVASDNIWNF